MFGISFIFPLEEKLSGQLKLYPQKLSDSEIESRTFAKISLFFKGGLYTPSWEKKKMDFSDTVYLLSFFSQLIDGIKNAESGKKQSVWFVDNPINLEFKKAGKMAKVWINEDGKIVNETEILWKEFFTKCRESSQKLYQLLIVINPKLSKNAEVKKLRNL